MCVPLFAYAVTVLVPLSVVTVTLTDSGTSADTVITGSAYPISASKPSTVRSVLPVLQAACQHRAVQ